jgi:hypothetical protein
MPNVTVFMPASEIPPEADLAAFTAACTDLCTGRLRAGLDKVHIIVVPVLAAGRGHRAYIEVKYRLETFRPAEVMEDFVARLDQVASEYLRTTTRIRCFGYGPEAIYAVN